MAQPRNVMSPFSEIFETNRFPNARTLRTSYSQKLWDTFHVVAGNVFTEEGPQTHIGIFDYLTLGIPFVAVYLLGMTNTDDMQWYDYIYFIAMAVINLPLIALRVGLGAAVTLLLSPLLGLVQGISWLISGKSYQEALELRGNIALEQGTQEVTLNQFLEVNNMNIEELEVNIDNKTQEIRIAHKRGRCFTVVDNAGQSKNIHSLFAHNIGNAVSNLEDKQDENILNTFLNI